LETATDELVIKQQPERLSARNRIALTSLSHATIIAPWLVDLPALLPVP
jgi:hypothetical protein